MNRKQSRQKPNMLRDYIFTDERRIDSYLEQLGKLDATKRKLTKKFGVSLAGPTFEIEQQKVAREQGLHEKILTLKEELAERGLLADARPVEMPPPNRILRPFVFEKTLAKKMIFPRELLAAVPSIREFAVWVSDPNPDDFNLNGEPWEFTSTFLYLSETHIDGQGFRTVYSGCSALQAIANAVSGSPILATNTREPLGRGSDLHPIEKLRALGAQAGDERQIECLYQMRYMTDEQCYTVDSRKRRVNDLLGYPLYIAEPIG